MTIAKVLEETLQVVDVSLSLSLSNNVIIISPIDNAILIKRLIRLYSNCEILYESARTLYKPGKVPTFILNPDTYPYYSEKTDYTLIQVIDNKYIDIIHKNINLARERTPKINNYTGPYNIIYYVIPNKRHKRSYMSFVNKESSNVTKDEIITEDKFTKQLGVLSVQLTPNILQRYNYIIRLLADFEEESTVWYPELNENRVYNVEYLTNHIIQEEQ